MFCVVQIAYLRQPATGEHFALQPGSINMRQLWSDGRPTVNADASWPAAIEVATTSKFTH